MNTIEKTDKFNGKTLSIARLTISADGKSMTIRVKNVQDGATSQFTLTKQ